MQQPIMSGDELRTPPSIALPGASDIEGGELVILVQALILERLSEMILERLPKMAQILLHSSVVVDNHVLAAHEPALAQILMILVDCP